MDFVSSNSGNAVNPLFENLGFQNYLTGLHAIDTQKEGWTDI